MKVVLFDAGGAPGWDREVRFAPSPSYDQLRAVLLYESERISVSSEEFLRRCKTAGIPKKAIEKTYVNVGPNTLDAWIIEVPDNDPNAAFAFRMFVQP